MQNRHHLLIGILLSSAACISALYLTINHPTSQTASHSAQSAASRPLHLAALDSVPNLPAYLLKLCGPEVIETHGGITADGELPAWFLQAAEILAENGLKWPTPKFGMEDPILKSNVHEHETRYAPMLATDPQAAVELLEPLIRYEEQKFLLRSWRAELANSAAENPGNPDLKLYQKILRDLPNRYFSSFIHETLQQNPSPLLAKLAISEAARRNPQERFLGLATVIENRTLDFSTRESAARALAPELHITFDPSKMNEIDWNFEASEYFR